ncbi:hypothetical protein VP01_6116g1 [Puccinia sorghi]|uniref:Uncharacterized protein n=1 Tax=Puccinia sorghi TaxID=27349 RepID=A0A0L6UH06_9BASI|nr:hypothetical protein VP01_6116g1 [Puccinia sorghi]
MSGNVECESCDIQFYGVRRNLFSFIVDHGPTTTPGDSFPYIALRSNEAEPDGSLIYGEQKASVLWTLFVRPSLGITILPISPTRKGAGRYNTRRQKMNHTEARWETEHISRRGLPTAGSLEWDSRNETTQVESVFKEHSPRSILSVTGEPVGLSVSGENTDVRAVTPTLAVVSEHTNVRAVAPSLAVVGQDADVRTIAPLLTVVLRGAVRGVGLLGEGAHVRTISPLWHVGGVVEGECTEGIPWTISWFDCIEWSCRSEHLIGICATGVIRAPQTPFPAGKLGLPILPFSDRSLHAPFLFHRLDFFLLCTVAFSNPPLPVLSHRRSRQVLCLPIFSRLRIACLYLHHARPEQC